MVKAQSEDKGIKNIRLKRAIYQAYLDKLQVEKVRHTQKEESVALSHITKSIYGYKKHQEAVEQLERVRDAATEFKKCFPEPNKKLSKFGGASYDVLKNFT